MAVLSHITLGTNDKSRSQAFYDPVFGVYLAFQASPETA